MKNADKAVILAGHGSRLADASRQMEKVAQDIKAIYPIVECAYLTINSPGIEESISRCIEKGAHLVIIMPYFLHAGVHVTLDLRKTVEAETRVRVILADHIGYHQKLSEVILERVETAK